MNIFWIGYGLPSWISPLYGTTTMTQCSTPMAISRLLSFRESSFDFELLVLSMQSGYIKRIMSVIHMSFRYILVQSECHRSASKEENSKSGAITVMEVKPIIIKQENRTRYFCCSSFLRISTSTRDLYSLNDRADKTALADNCSRVKVWLDRKCGRF